MIGRLVAALTTARSRPTTAVTALVGAALAAAGLTLLARYHRDQVQRLTIGEVELGKLDEALQLRKAQFDVANTELRRLRGRLADATREAYPAQKDLDPLDRGADADALTPAYLAQKAAEEHAGEQQQQ